MKVAEARVTRLRLGLEAHRPFPPGIPIRAQRQAPVQRSPVTTT